MKTNRKKLENAKSSREYKIWNYDLEPYPECSCLLKKWYKFKDKSNIIFRPFHNKKDHCRYGNSHKSWKNYRKTQWR